jgi:NAD-dependent deacetylase
MTNEAAFATAVELLGYARRLLVFTGAGVSAESGISTFRDRLTGLWEKFDPSQLATPTAFRNDPALVWGWYEWRRAQVAMTCPNAAHIAIAALKQHVPELTVVTQNVDDLHERAGSEEVIHLHGNLNAPRCFACARPHPLDVSSSNEMSPRYVAPPCCKYCGGKIRPGVVWFGEPLPNAEIRTAFNATKNSDLILSVGTSGMVYPAARIPEIAHECGVDIVHVNTEPADIANGTLLIGRAGEWLPALLSETFGNKQPLI